MVDPVALVAAGGDEVPRNHQEVRSGLVGEIGDAAHDVGLRLGVADRDEREGVAAIARGPEGLEASVEFLALDLADDAIEVLGVGLEAVEPELVQHCGLVVPPDPLERTGLVADPNLHRAGRGRLGDHAHRRRGRPDQERLDHPGQRRVETRRQRRKAGLAIEPRTNLRGSDRPRQDRDLPQTPVETVVLVAVEVAADRERLVARESNRPGLLATLADEFAVEVEVHLDAVVGADEMMPTAEFVGLPRGEIGQAAVGVVDAGTGQSEGRPAPVEAEQHAGLGIAVVLDRPDHPAPAKGAIDRHPRLQGDRLDRQRRIELVHPRRDHERRAAPAESHPVFPRRPDDVPDLADTRPADGDEVDPLGPPGPCRVRRLRLRQDRGERAARQGVDGDRVEHPLLLIRRGGRVPTPSQTTAVAIGS